jgi:hypothetical protein
VALSRSWEVVASASTIATRDHDGDPIPFAPANRVRGGLDWIPFRRDGTSARLGPRLEWIARTDPVKNDYAQPPEQAILVGMEGFAEFGAWKVSVRGTNLANATWRDPSDRLRYFAPQPGLDVGANLSRRF